jgi:ubiquinone/menaquinone biosynthesis C-methylase UbiE
MIGDHLSSAEITGSTHQVEYALGHSSRELDRLSFQGSLFAPFTRQLFTQAGIKPGMRVLDMGSGTGDVSFLAAELVGQGGHVLGVDRSPAAVERARARAIGRNHPNVSFVVGDPAVMQFDQPFDAIVGRFVLMYQDDPTDSLRKITRHVRPGGLVVFQEVDTSACRSCPAVYTFDEAAWWLAEALRRSGARPELGLEMHSLFLDSGLPAPGMRVDAMISGEAESPVYQLLAEAIRSLVPTLQKLNIASPANVQIDSLADRIREEVIVRRAVVVSYGLVGAWAKKPLTPAPGN